MYAFHYSIGLRSIPSDTQIIIINLDQIEIRKRVVGGYTQHLFASIDTLHGSDLPYEFSRNQYLITCKKCNL